MADRPVDTFNIVSFVSGGLSAILSAVMDNPIAQWVIFGLSIALIILNIISSAISAYKKAKSDGRVTLDEVQQIIEDSADKLQAGLDDLKRKDKDNND